MIQLYFRSRTGVLADFAADLNAFCTQCGYAPLFADGTVGTVEFQGVMRFDFDAFGLDIVAPDGSIQPRGLHINCEGTVLPFADPTVASQAAAQFAQNVASYFSQTYTNPPPDAYPDRGGQTWPSTDKTIWINTSINIQKRLGA